MENYIVSARKYRPDTFESVVAQKALTTTLKNAISTGKLAHAYLFCGPRGVGKTTCARIFAKTINCEHPTPDGEPCNKCESCLSFNQQRSFSIYELDAASNNSVDDIRGLNEQVRIPPQIGRYKVYIIDEVHMLSSSAFNAFLKTLEEPPAHAIFILATTEKHKIIPTILSRCQIYDFSRIDSGDIIGHLKNIAERENIKCEYDALRIIAQKSDGCMRDALSLFDQMASFTQGNLTYDKVIENLNILDYDYYFKFTDSVLAADISRLLLLFNEILNKGFEGNVFIGGLASHFRDLLVASDEATHPLLEYSEELKNRYIRQAASCTSEFLFKAIKLCTDCDMNYRASNNKRLLVELTIIRLSQLNVSASSEKSDEDVDKRLKPVFSASVQTVKSEEKTVDDKQFRNVANRQEANVIQLPENVGRQNLQNYQQPVDNSVKTHENKTSEIETNVLTGRPEALKRSLSADKTFLGGMFQRTNSVSTQTRDMKDGVEIEKQKSSNEKNETVAVTELTQDSLLRTWFEFALKLPVTERALGDRMKIINPELCEKNTFLIRVDNKLVAELFLKEAKRITSYISEHLSCGEITMKIEQNQQQTQRRIYNRTEQFKLLTEKNAVLDKLRANLNLDFF